MLILLIIDDKDHAYPENEHYEIGTPKTGCLINCIKLIN